MEILFEHLFRDIILERGYSYYLNNQVKIMKKTGKIITANVVGSEVYDIEVTMNENKIVDMDCDCPYFYGGYNCKHLAAVLYAVSKSGFNEENTFIEDTVIMSTEEILKSLSYEEIIEFLNDELAFNKDLLFKFRAKFQKENSNEDISYYRNHIDTVVNHHLGYDNFINYNGISAFQQDMDEVFESIEDLVSNQEHKIAFELIKHIIHIISNLDLDDSFGTTGTIMDDLVNILCDIINDCPSNLYNQVFDWLCGMIDGKILDYLEDDLITFFLEYYNEEDKIIKKIEITDNIISNITNTHSWSDEWKLTRWVQNKITLLNMIEGKEAEVLTILQKYVHLASIRDILIDDHIANKDYEKAIELLIDGKKLYLDKPGIVSKYSNELIMIYRLTKNSVGLLEESKRRLFIYSPNSLDAYKEYKALFTPPKWEIERYVVLEQLKKIRCDIKVYFAEERMLTQLLMEIKNSTYLSGLDTYEDMLIDVFSSELLEMFIDRVQNMAVHTGDRKHYKNIVSELKRIQKYPDGEIIVKNILTEWRVKYRNRRAMMEELNVIRVK